MQSLAPWAEALKPQWNDTETGLVPLSNVTDSLVATAIFVPGMPFTTSSGPLWTVIRFASGLFFPPMLLPSVEGFCRNSYRFASALLVGNPPKPVPGLFDGIKDFFGLGVKKEPESNGILKRLKNITVNLLETATSSFVALHAISERIDFSKLSGPGIDQSSLWTANASFADAMQYLTTGMFLWPLAQSYRNDGVGGVLDQAPYYLTFAAYGNLLPQESVTLPLGTLAVSAVQSIGIITTTDPAEVGRYLLMFGPLPIKWVIKGTWKILTFWKALPILSIPQMAWDETKMSVFHAFGSLRSAYLNTALLNGATIAEKLARGARLP